MTAHNANPGPCEKCKKYVEAKKGRVEIVKGRFVLLCSKCLPAPEEVAIV